MFTYCGQVKVEKLANGVTRFTFLTEANGAVISQVVMAESDARELRDLLNRLLAEEVKH